MIKEAVLIVAPHADDEILGCGGYISSNQYDKDIHVIIVAHRDQYRHDNIVNINEIEKRYRIKYHLLNNIDERLDTISSSDLTKQIERLYQKIKPTRVFIPFSNDINSDHAAVHKSSLISFRKIQDLQPRELLMYEVPSSTTQGSRPFFPNYYYALDKNDVEAKWDMLSFYKSELRPYPNPRSKQGIETYARFRGMECNKEFAEAYISLYIINGKTS
jgi:LmbE family N-acetylglucosaminyl deacetylase